MNIRTLYQEMILDHGRHPRNYHVLSAANRQAEGFNQLCGDKLTIYLYITEQIIQEISFVGCGCAISMASASLLTETLKGKTEQEAQILFQQFHALLTDREDQNNFPRELGKLQVFSGVKQYPARVKCATLAWHTLEAALLQKKETICTEKTN